MVSYKKENITIKGNKEGLVFIIKEDCPFEEVVYELKNKLEKSHQNLLDGPTTNVKIETGYRPLNELQKDSIRGIFRTKNNLLINSIENEIERIEKLVKDHVIIRTGTIRSGQVIQIDGNILFIGDINPGGTLIASGSIYVIGSLMGIAHAGFFGDKKSIIVASDMNPIQLRITDVIRNIFGGQDDDKESLFAYLQEERIILSDYNNLSKFDLHIGI